MTDAYRAVIVDDERIARVGLRAMLSRHPQLRVIGEARDGEEAAAIIRDLRPHVVFLDIQMPGRDGFGVIRELAAVGRPAAYVFVTARVACRPASIASSARGLARDVTSPTCRALAAANGRRRGVRRTR